MIKYLKLKYTTTKLQNIQQQTIITAIVNII